jgi:hypothetical protein
VKSRSFGRTRRSGAKVLQADLVRACEVSEVRRERSALQVREHAGNGVAPAGRDGLAQRALRADEDGAGDEELGHVDVERGLRGTKRRR